MGLRLIQLKAETWAKATPLLQLAEVVVLTSGC